MKSRYLLLFVIFTTMILCGCASAENVTSSVVDNCNIYAGSNEFPIAPAAEIDATSAASNIASENALIRIAHISVDSIGSTQEKQITAIIHGSTASLGESNIYVDYDTGYLIDYGDGESLDQNPLTIYLSHTYPYATSYTIVMTVSNYLAGAISESFVFGQTYGGYQTYSGDFIPIIALFAIIPLIVLISMIYLFLNGSADINILIPAVVMIIVAIVLIMVFVMIGGVVDNATANFFK